MIFSIFEKDYYQIYRVSPELPASEKERSEKSYSSFTQKCNYYKNIILGEMIEYYRYLGFTKLEGHPIPRPPIGRSVSIVRVINKEGYSLSFENNSISLNHNIYSKIDGKVISDTNLEFIKEFLKSVREFWKEKYSKFLVRPKLRPIINFNDLSGFKNPNVRYMNLK